MFKISIDFETYSELSLKEVGTYNYARHDSTLPLCMAYRINGSEEQLWKLGEPFPDDLRDAIDSREYEMWAFNATFEYYIWQFCCEKKLCWPAIHPLKWRCTQARASYNGLQRNLAGAAKQINGDDGQKDAAGHKLMLDVTKPIKYRKQSYIWGMARFHEKNDPKLPAVYDYCKQDVFAEASVAKKTIPLPDFEQYLWHVHNRINLRGMPVDVELCRRAAELLHQGHIRACIDLSEMTNNVITAPTQVERIKKYCREKGWPITPMPGVDTGEHSDTLALEFLQLHLDDPRTPDDIRAILQTRADNQSAAVKKFVAANAMMCEEGRVRNAYKYYQAGTGRWGGAGVQFQNLVHPAKGFEFTDTLRRDLMEMDYVELREHWGNPVKILQNLVRSMVRVRDGNWFIESDLSGIENRVTHWMAGDHVTLEKFRNKTDLYLDFIQEVDGVEPGTYDKDHPRRKVGKAAVLGLGFGMGWDKFKNTTPGIDTEEEARNLVTAYRTKFAEVKQLWRTMAQSALACYRTGKPIRAAKVWFEMHSAGNLHMILPSGRHLIYRNVQEHEGPFGPELLYQSSKGGAWQALTPPILTENAVQGTARDLLAIAMCQADHENLFIVGHTHDSLYMECREGDQRSVARLTQIMQIVPDWATGLPIATETEIGTTMANGVETGKIPWYNGG